MSARNDYLTSEAENNPTTNGAGEGTPRRKAFSLAPARDPETEKILQCRRDATMHVVLGDGACRMFVFLLDLALSRDASPKRGVVTISATKLGECLSQRRLGKDGTVRARPRSNRTIYGWTQELLSTGLIWVTKKFMPNFFPMTVYHISALDPPLHPHQMDTHDGLWGNGKTRSLPGQGSASRSIHGKFLPCSETQDSPNMQQFATQSGNIPPPSAAIICRSQRQESAAQSGNNLPLPAVETCRSERQEFAAGSGRNLPLPAAENRTHKKELKKEIKQDRSRSTLKAINRLGNRSGEKSGKGVRLRVSADEKDFMEACGQAFDAREMKENGGGWRERYRQNPDKAWRAIRETLRAKKEEPHRLKTTWGAYATDIYLKRFA